MVMKEKLVHKVKDKPKLLGGRKRVEEKEHVVEGTHGKDIKVKEKVVREED
jgi:hypothetical protein